MSGVLLSEWTKIRSLRSTVWTLLTAVVLMLGFGFLASAVAASQGANAAFTDPAAAGLAGDQLAMLVIAALGVLTVSGEYRTGMIRTTLLATPDRLRMLAAKTAVFAAVTFTVSLVASVASFLIAQAILGEAGATPTEPEMVRAVVGSALFLTASGVFGLALGTLIRHTAGAIVAAVALMIVLPAMANLLPGDWGDTVHALFTTYAGIQITYTEVPDGALGPWAGFGVYCLWIAVTMTAATVLLLRRDA